MERDGSRGYLISPRLLSACPAGKSDAEHEAFRGLGSAKTRDALRRPQQRLQLSIFAACLLTTQPDCRESNDVLGTGGWGGQFS